MVHQVSSDTSFSKDVHVSPISETSMLTLPESPF